MPFSGPIRDRQGNLYGTTFYGGSFGDGSVFGIDRQGRFRILHSFDGAGAYPEPPWRLMRQETCMGPLPGVATSTAIAAWCTSSRSTNCEWFNSFPLDFPIAGTCCPFGRSNDRCPLKSAYKLLLRYLNSGPAPSTEYS